MRNLLLLILLIFCLSTNGQSINIDTAKWCTEQGNGEIIYFETEVISFRNNTPNNLILFFVENHIDSLQRKVLLKKKLLRRYGDFSLSMLEWEPNMTIEQNSVLVPELFVKCLQPKACFNIILLPDTLHSHTKQSSWEIIKHTLVCEEFLFNSDLISMPNFVKNLHRYAFDYPYSFIVIDIKKFQSFIRNR